MNAPRLWRLALALVFATIADYATRAAVKLGDIDKKQVLDSLRGPVTEAEFAQIKSLFTPEDVAQLYQSKVRGRCSRP